MPGAAAGHLPSAGDPAAGLVAAGTLGFRPFGLADPALFRAGIQQASVPAQVVRAIIPAAERGLPALQRRDARLRDAGRLVPAGGMEFPGRVGGRAGPSRSSNCGAPSAPGGQRLWEDTGRRGNQGISEWCRQRG